MLKGLQAYFGSINRADYQAAYNAMGWKYHKTGDVVPKETTSGWGSTYDFNIRIRDTKGSGSTSQAWITFDSIFGYGMGVAGLTCARWSMDYTFVRDGNRLEINSNKPHGGTRDAWVPC
jgi:hypothetical protein